MIRQKCHAGNSVASWRKTEIPNLVRLAPDNGACGVMMIFSKLKSMFGKSAVHESLPGSPVAASNAASGKAAKKTSQPKAVFNIQGAEGNIISGAPKQVRGVSRVEFAGQNNRLIFGKNVTLDKCLIVFTDDNGSIEIGNNVLLRGEIRVTRECRISIGNDTKCNKPCRVHAANRTSILIGSHCLLANVSLRSSDAHSIIDLKSGEKQKKSADIIVGDRVWIAENVSIYKGSIIGNGSIVGGGSIVTKQFPENVLIAGVPAAVVKTDVTWSEV